MQRLNRRSHSLCRLSACLVSLSRHHETLTTTYTNQEDTICKFWNACQFVLSPGLYIQTSSNMGSKEPHYPSFLDVVKLCDNYYPDSAEGKANRTISFRATPDGPSVGLLLPEVVDALLAHNAHRHAQSQSEHWIVRAGSFASLAPVLSTPAARTRAIYETTIWWRDTGRFPADISPKQWRGEWYAVYLDPVGPMSHQGGNPIQESDDGDNPNYAFSIERSACALFGVVTYGVHMTVYEKGEGGSIFIWVPRRAATKQTCALFAASVRSSRLTRMPLY
jgi:hypothetical protein